MFSEIILNTIGVFDVQIDIKPYKQVKIKDIFNYDIFLYIVENRIHIYAFDRVISEVSNNLINYNHQKELDRSYDFANFIYSYGYYKIRFRPIIYSLNDDTVITPLDINDYINIYQKKDMPIEFYKLTNDIFNRVAIISHLLYRFELNKFINNLKK